MSRQVFISYSRRDGNSYAERLQQQLEAAGYRVWRDTRNINPNQDFTAEIELGIEQSDVVAVCVTPDIRRDNSFVRREIQYADVVKKPIFPCRVTDVPPPLPIINKEWLEFHRDWDSSLARLLQLVIDPNLHMPSGTYQQQLDDPFKDYLQKLYREIVRYLDQAVIKLIDLEAENTPEAVPQTQRDDILLEFFESSIFTDNTPREELPKHITFKDAFDHHKGRLLLLGEPGAGKTITLMSYARDAVAARLSDSKQPLPILKIIASWKSNPPVSISDWVTEKMDSLKPVMQNGNALLLLDGLDELGELREVKEERKDPATGEKEILVIESYDPRQRFIDALVDIHANNQVLVTCRVQDYAAIGQQIPLEGAITLQPLTDDQLKDYLADHPEIYAAIQTDQQLRDLSRTPLLLSLITFAWDKLDESLKSKGDLQVGDVRDAIFEAYCRQRYEHEAKKRNADLPFTYHEIMDILGELAMWNASLVHPENNGYSGIEENVLSLRSFENIIGDKDRIIAFQEMMIRLNILIQIDDGYRFVHVLLRDFLVYRFAFAHIEDETWHKKHLWVNPINALGNVGDRRAVESLIGCLQNTNHHIRRSAAIALGRIRDRSAVEPLLLCLNDDDEFVQTATIMSLGQIGDTSALGPLINYLDNYESNKHEGIRELAIVLAKFGDPKVIDPLKKHLDVEDNWYTVYILEALSNFDDPLLTEIFVNRLWNPDEEVRNVAVMALNKQGWKPQSLDEKRHYFAAGEKWEDFAALGEVVIEELIDFSYNYLADGSDHSINCDVIKSLKKFRDQRVISHLIKCLGYTDSCHVSSSEARVCDVAYDALQKIGTPEALEACEAWVKSGNKQRKSD